MSSLLQAAIVAGQPVSNEVEFDFSRIHFIESIGVVILSNLIEWLKKRHVHVTYRVADTHHPAISYLDDIGFFRTYWGEPISRQARLRATTFSFTSLQCGQVHQWIDGNFFPWLSYHLSCRTTSLYRLKASIREIFNNIADHSEEEIGCMHAQWYPANERVRIAISDFGVGIPAEVRKVLPAATDVQAVHWAFQEGNSSKRGRNMGAGLHYLVESAVEYHKGWLGLYSGTGSMTFNRVTRAGNCSLLTTGYPGTLINMALPTQDLPEHENEVAELEW